MKNFNKTYSKQPTKRLKRFKKWQFMVISLCLLSLFTSLNFITLWEMYMPDINTAYAMTEPKQPELSMIEYVFNELERELGFDEAIKGYNIIKCESSWRADVVTNEPNKTVSLGLWQINSIHKDISNVDKLDYKKATAWAIAKRLHDKNWSAWSCSKILKIK